MCVESSKLSEALGIDAFREGHDTLNNCLISGCHVL
jgi:hypothetical protein